MNDVSCYEWSSYNTYIQPPKRTLVNVERVDKYFQNVSEFIEFMNMTNTDKCLEYAEKTKYTDEKLKDKILSRYKVELIKDLLKQERDYLIREINN